MHNLSKSIMVALFSWATWANCSWSLFCHEQPEQIAHGCSFVMSNLSDLLTVAHLSWTISANHSQSLFKMSNFEQMSEFPTPIKSIFKKFGLVLIAEKFWGVSKWIQILLNVFDFINSLNPFKLNKSLNWKYSETQQLPAIV